MTNTPEATPTAATTWFVWNNEHRAWRCPGHRGYTSRLEDANRYSFEEALALCENANRQTPFPYESMFPTDFASAITTAEARGEARGREAERKACAELAREFRNGTIASAIEARTQEDQPGESQ